MMPSNRSTTDDPSGSGNPDLYEYSIIFNSKVNDTSIALRKVNQRLSGMCSTVILIPDHAESYLMHNYCWDRLVSH